MRPHQVTKVATCLALAASLAALGPGSARAEDNGQSLYKMTIGKVMSGLGFKSADDENEINYRERPPLAIPSSRTLPPPEKTEAVSNPAWPKDPDVTRRKLEAKREKERPDRETERRLSEDPKAMTQDALTPGPRPRGVANRDVAPKSSGDLMTPSELGRKPGFLGNIFKGKNDDIGQFTSEPPRASLTDPPPGYQTPSPDQPYGVTVSAPKAENNYEKRVEPVK